MSLLDSDLPTRIHERATDTGATNTYPEKDLEELREAEHPSALIPTGLGGAGLSPTGIIAEQTALAKAVPSTTLDISMHQIIVGLGHYLVTNGSAHNEQILRDAVVGEVFGFGISESSDDLMLFDSAMRAIATADGGYSFESTKIFTSLSPVRTHLLIFGRAETEKGPKSVFGIVHRDDEGYLIKDDQNTLGMRTTQPMTTLFEGVTVPEGRTLTITDPKSSANPVILGIFSHPEILLAATYQDVDKRAVEVAAGHVVTRCSVKNQTTYSSNSDIRWYTVEVALIMDAVGPQIRGLACDIDEGVDHGRSWMPQLSAMKDVTAETTLRAIEQAMRTCGGSTYHNMHEFSHLYRDALAGLFQPSDQEPLYAMWVNLTLGPIEKTQ